MNDSSIFYTFKKEIQDTLAIVNQIKPMKLTGKFCDFNIFWNFFLSGTLDYWSTSCYLISRTIQQNEIWCTLASLLDLF